MVKINNLDVIQKLVDELNLYPGTDVIPTELAEKILPCFIINNQNITVSPTEANVVKAGAVTGSASTTIYTVPSTGDFYLTNVHVSGCAGASTTGIREVDVEVTIDGTTVQIITLIIETTATDLMVNSRGSLNLQNPIKLDQGSVITVNGNSAEVDGRANIVGYTSQ